MCTRFRKEIKNDNWIKNVCFMDKAYFCLNWTVNSQNCRIWVKEVSNEVNEHPLHSGKGTPTACCALSANGIFDPLWFQEHHRHLSRVIATSRVKICNLINQWFQQDVATPHTAIATMRYRDDLFGGNVIPKKSAYLWSPRSQDLCPLDFYLRGYCKANENHNKLQNVIELQRSVKDFIANISRGTC